MKITWYGTASLLLQHGHQTIVFDPFCKLPIHGLKNDTKPLLHGESFSQAQEVFITHGHLDHLYHVPRLYGNRNDVKIFCTETPRRTLIATGMVSEQITTIKPGWKETHGAFRIEAFQSKHCRFDLPLILHIMSSKRTWQSPLYAIQLLLESKKYPQNNEILFYEIGCDGIRLQIMGSMNLCADVDYPTGADVLILALQGRSDQDTYALKFVDRLRPKKIFLYHIDDAFPPLTETVDTSGFIRNVWEQFNIPCEPFIEGVPVEVGTV